MTNEDAIKWLDNLKNDIGNPHYERLWPYAQAIDEVITILEEQPEIVHCKDCKYAVLTYSGECKYCKKRIDDNGGMEKLYLPGDWFCADGERGENNGNKV